MKRKKSGAIEWLEFELLQDIPEIVHGVFLRHGGVSHPPFHSLNMGLGDDPLAVIENQRRICTILGISELIHGKLVHGKHLEIVENEVPAECCDGLITQTKGVGLLTSHADCQAAIFYDPIHKAIANVHAGWRGNVQNIYREAVLKMEHAIGTKPEDLLVCISPSLGPDASEFKNYREELPSSFLPYQFKPYHFNLWEIARDQLEDAGVLPHHIEIACLCTFQQSQDFFSYRRDKVTGRNATIIALAKDLPSRYLKE